MGTSEVAMSDVVSFGDPEGPMGGPGPGVVSIVRPAPVANAAGLLIAAAVVEVVLSLLSLILPGGPVGELRRELRSVPASHLPLVVGLAVAILVAIETLFTASLATVGLLVRNGRGWARPLVVLLALAELTLVTTTGAGQPLSLTFAIAAALLVLLPSSTSFFRAVKQGRRSGRTVLLLDFKDRQWRARWRRWLARILPGARGA